MAAVNYRRWDADDRVSDQWHIVLSAARRDGVSFVVTDGHRTLAEQEDRFAVFIRDGRPRAARPSPTAPHIRSGRPDHAVDVNSRDGGAGRLAAWPRRKGARATFPVPGEPWHIEVPRGDLERLARELADPLAGFPANERRWIRSYDRWMELKREGRDTAEAREQRQRLRRLMERRCRAIARAARQSGWARHHRRDRFRSLESRTR
jgi:hypothetical protein